MSRALTRALVASIFAAATGSAVAQPDNSFTFGVGYLMPDSGRNASHGVSGSAGFAWHLAGPLWIENRVFATVLSADEGNGSFSQIGLGADGVLPLGIAAGHRGPFALVGAGIIRNDVTPDALDGNSAFVDAGLGWRGPARPGAASQRVELRARHDRFAGGQLDALLAFSIEFGIGAATAAATAPAMVPAPPQLVRIETPPPPPRDTDGDGIPDENDRCEQTLPGATVESDGCVSQEQTVTLSNIRFEPGSARLTQDSYAQLDRLAAFFTHQPETRMDIYGHTDSQGRESYNLALSTQRAAAVRTYLVNKDVPPGRLKAQGYGESRPIDTNDTEAGRARNRRVELHLHARRRH